MPEPFEFDIVSTASGDGAEKTVAGLEAVQAEVAKTAEGFDVLNATQRAQVVANPADIAQQRAIILELYRSQLELEVEGKQVEADKIATEIAGRRMAIQLQQQARIGEAEALTIAEEIVVAKTSAALKEEEMSVIAAARERDQQAALQERMEEQAEARQKEIEGYRQMEAEQYAAWQERKAQLAEEYEATIRLRTAREENEAELIADQNRLATEREITQQKEQQLVLAEETAAADDADGPGGGGGGPRGIGMAGRIAGMIGGGGVGLAVTALVAVSAAYNRIAEESQKLQTDLDTIGSHSETMKGKVQALSTAVKEAASNQGTWDAALKLANADLDEQSKALDRAAASQDMIAAAQEKLAIAKINADKSLTPDQKDDAIAKITQQADDREARNKEQRDTDQIQIAAERIEKANVAQSQQAIKAQDMEKAAAAAQATLDAARKENKEKQDVAKNLTYQDKGLTGLGIKLEDLSDFNDPTQRDRDAENARKEADEAKRKEAAAEKKADQISKAAEAAAKAATEAQENYKRELAEQEDRIKDLQSDRANTATAAGLNDQTAAVTAGGKDSGNATKQDEYNSEVAAVLSRGHDLVNKISVDKMKEDRVKVDRDLTAMLELNKELIALFQSAFANTASKKDLAAEAAQLRAIVASLRPTH